MHADAALKHIMMIVRVVCGDGGGGGDDGNSNAVVIILLSAYIYIYMMNLYILISTN